MPNAKVQDLTPIGAKDAQGLAFKAAAVFA
jgi:hypothetical protein